MLYVRYSCTPIRFYLGLYVEAYGLLGVECNSLEIENAGLTGGGGDLFGTSGLQGYLARKKMPIPLGRPWEPRHRPTVGFQGGAFSYERGTPSPVKRMRKCSAKGPFWARIQGS